ncbi:hypothetical protein HT746_06605 [Burkholderia pyrrocinia]|nr:hypothetical protein [Burkholderia pyrrocinia]
MTNVRAAWLAPMLPGGFVAAPASFATLPKPAATLAPAFAAGLQYNTAHVSVAPRISTASPTMSSRRLGGSKSKQVVFQVTPTSSQTLSRLVFTPSGTISVFVFKTPIRTGARGLPRDRHGHGHTGTRVMSKRGPEYSIEHGPEIQSADLMLVSPTRLSPRADSQAPRRSNSKFV